MTQTCEGSGKEITPRVVPSSGSTVGRCPVCMKLHVLFRVYSRHGDRFRLPHHFVRSEE